MISKSFVELVKCRWREFRREPSAFFWVIFMPILWMVVLGIAFSNPKPERYGVGWFNNNPQSSRSDAIKDALSESPQVKIRIGDAEEMTKLFQRGEIVIAVRVGDDVTYDFEPENPESVRAKNFVNDLTQKSQGREDTVKTMENPISGVGRRYVDFLIPGLLGLSIMTSSLFGSGMTIVSNRKENLLKRYLATPMKKYEFLFSHVVGRFIILFAEFTAIMISSYLIFKFSVIGSVLSYALFAILGAASFTAIALLCASRTRSVPMMGGLINLITIPLTMLSGVFFSKTNFPDAMLGFIGYLPLTALNDGLRKIALEGQSIMALGHEATILAVYMIVAMVAGKLLFRWF